MPAQKWLSLRIYPRNVCLSLDAVLNIGLGLVRLGRVRQVWARLGLAGPGKGCYQQAASFNKGAVLVAIPDLETERNDMSDRDYWLNRYGIEAAQFLNQLRMDDHFTGEEVHQHVRAKIGDPDQPNLWGCSFRILINQEILNGRVVVTGIKKSVRASCRSHYYRVYRRIA